MRTACNLIPAFAALVVALTPAGAARAAWRDPIAGAPAILPTQFESRALTVHAAPRRQPGLDDVGVPPPRWSLPLVDRHLEPSSRFAPLAAELVETINRVEPIYDPTLLEGPNVVASMQVSAGTAETRDIFGDHWRIASADPNVDADARPLANAWTAGPTPRPCGAYRVHRLREWNEPALSAPSLADCRAIRARQAGGFADTAPIPVAVAAPPIPVFAAPEPGSRMSSADFWAAQRARIASIHSHLLRKWRGPQQKIVRAALR